MNGEILMSLENPNIPADWGLEIENPHSKRLNEQIGALARRLVKSFKETQGDKEARKQLIHTYYRKFYTMTLCKSCQTAGVNSSPARDRILDFPWWELEEDRFMCLKIWEKIKYGTEFMGLNDTREINLNGTITLSSKANFANWKLNTTSKIEDFEWNESPSIVVAGKNVPITYIINPTLSIFKGKIAKMIDEAINKSCDFKTQVMQVLETLSTPFMANETYETWFKLVPNEMYSTNAVLSNSKIKMNLGLKCQMQTLIGQKPKSGFDKTKIVSKAVAKIPSDFNASVAAVSSYESASRIMTKNFAGQEFGSGKRKITVQKVALWYKDGKMIIALDMLGSVNGTIYLAGIPKYKAETKEIYFEEMDYVLNTKGILTRTANWLLQGVILNKIKENCKYSIQPNLEEGKKSMLPYLTNYSPMKGVFVNGKLNDFVFEKMELTESGIVAFITSSGSMKITIDGME
jgi:hypothetical protein